MDPPSRIDLYDDWNGWATTAALTELPTANGNDPFALYRFVQVRLLFTQGDDGTLLPGWGHRVGWLDS